MSSFLYQIVNVTFSLFSAMIMLFSLQLVAVLLISVAAYGKAVAIITSLAIMGGVITCGVILLFIAVIGLIGAVKHHQVMLFFVSFQL